MAGILSSIVTVLLIVIYIPALILLFVYSANLYYMTILAWWRRKQRPRSAVLTELPMITVQLPLYNERFVSQRIIDAAARGLKLPMDRFIVNLDRYGNTSTASIPIAMVEAVAAVRERLVRSTAALEAAAVPYAVVGDIAVREWVSRANPSAVRNAPAVDILLLRSDLPKASQALESVGFVFSSPAARR